MIHTLSIALRFASRELRSGLQGFRIFLACLILGVGAIAIVGALSVALNEGIANEGRSLMGGDIEFSTQFDNPTDQQRSFIESAGRISKVATLRAMAAKPEATSALVEVKVVDNAYPLYGELQLEPDMTTANAFKPDASGRPGTIAEASLLARLGLKQGDVLRLGNAELVINAVIKREPDRISDGFVLAPRLMISNDSLEATGLVRPGSIVNWRYRVAVPQPASQQDMSELSASAQPLLADKGWRVRTSENAAPGVRRFIDRLTFFLSLVGLTSLIVGGVGVANAVRAFLERRTTNIGILKCLGSSSNIIFWTYFIEVMLVATLGIAIAALLGLATPVFASWLLSEILPVPVSVSLQVWPVVRAAIFGYLIVIAFSVWPLAQAGHIPPTSLFRGLLNPARRWPGISSVMCVALALMAIYMLAQNAFPDPRITTGFAVGIIVSFIILAALGHLLMWLAARTAKPKSAITRLAVANIHRPGTPTPSITLALGLGLTLFVTLSLIDSNVSKELRDNLPDKAPSFFFLDVASTEADDFSSQLTTAGATSVSRAPMLRGRIVKVNGVASSKVEVSSDAAWALRGDRGLTYSATAPEGVQLTEGEWWSKNHQGKPLVSFSADIAEGMNLKLGDTVTVNVLGRDITAEVANFRAVDWRTLQINFVMMFSPNTFAGAPHMFVITARSDPANELGILAALSKPFPTVTSIRIRDALDAINKLMGQLITAIRGANAITLFSGILVLGGALATGLSRRVHDTVILKTFGATTSQLLKALIIEYAVLGLATAAFAVIAGSLSAWAVITQILGIEWQFSMAVAVITALAALVLTVGAGLITTWSALKSNPARVLRVD